MQIRELTAYGGSERLVALLAGYGGVGELGAATVAELTLVPAIGEKVAAEIKEQLMPPPAQGAKQRGGKRR